jgi:cysteinyl-tRNA synthetase
MLKLYNSLSKKKENFKSITKNNVNMYTCGPTVYDYAHIGNFRAYIVADLLKRYLEYKKFKVKHVMNITDVDDKTIKRSQEDGLSLKKFTEKYTKAFFEDLEKLNIEKANYYPRATDCIKEMVVLIEKLIKEGYAYKTQDGIYFSISKFKNYGKLAGLDLENLKAGARVKQDEYDKEKLNDFALWKSYDKTDGKVFWDTSLGKGRPGWHIECSVMSSKYLGKHFDIHTGGIDLIFPHHTNEIAQSESVNKCKFVNYWIHNEFLLVNGKKMSKSLGNFYTLRDLVSKGYDPLTVRYVLMSGHYRQQLNFTLKGLDSAKISIDRLKEKVLKFKDSKDSKGSVSKYVKNFEKVLDDDLNMPLALEVVWGLIKDSKIGGKLKYKTLLGFDKILGLKLKDLKIEKFSKEILDLIKERDKVRKEKNWSESDRIREVLSKKGVKVSDDIKGSSYTKAL